MKECLYEIDPATGEATILGVLFCYHAQGWGCGEEFVGGELGTDGV